MIHKPLNVRILVLAAVVAGLVYVAIAALVNVKLLVDLNAVPVTAEALSAAFGRADGAVIPWVVAMVGLCLIVGTAFSSLPTYADEPQRSGSEGSRLSWIWFSADDDIDCPSSWASDDEFRINPTTGLPMMGANSLLDVGGNVWCAAE